VLAGLAAKHGTPRFAAVGDITADHSEAGDPGSSRSVAR
jgi:hypothetical protein